MSKKTKKRKFWQKNKPEQQHTDTQDPKPKAQGEGAEEQAEPTEDAQRLKVTTKGEAEKRERRIFKRRNRAPKQHYADHYCEMQWRPDARISIYWPKPYSREELEFFIFAKFRPETLKGFDTPEERVREVIRRLNDEL